MCVFQGVVWWTKELNSKFEAEGGYRSSAKSIVEDSVSEGVKCLQGVSV
jgi:hypothetical protein